MSSMEEPPRLLDDPHTGDALRDALEAGRAEAPSEAQLASLLGGLGPLIGPGGGGGGSGGGPPVDPAGPSLVGSSAAVKGIAAMAVVAAVAAGGALVWSSSDEEPRTARTEATGEGIEREEPVDPTPDAPRVVPEGVDVPAELLAPERAPDRARDRGPERAAEPAPPTFEVDPAAEAALLRRAQAVLAADPSAALASTEEHAGRFGDGTLAQEREVVAIEALHRLGRDDAARRRASAFRTRWPRSAHGRRIDVILDDASEGSPGAP